MLCLGDLLPPPRWKVEGRFPMHAGRYKVSSLYKTASAVLFDGSTRCTDSTIADLKHVASGAVLEQNVPRHAALAVPDAQKQPAAAHLNMIDSNAMLLAAL